MANAEKLFGLSITLYPELLDMEKELKGLDQIFTIYENQKVGICFLISMLLCTRSLLYSTEEPVFDFTNQPCLLGKKVKEK